MRKNKFDFFRKIRQIERKRARLLDRLLVKEPLLMGSFSKVLRTCGKPNCHCAKTPAHEVWVLMTHRDSKARCQVVRKADVGDIRSRINTYKTFRSDLRELEAIQKNLKALLRGFLEDRNVPYE